MTEPSLPQESIFLQALEIAPAGRAAFLDRACAGDAALRADVEGLLRAHDRPGGLLDIPETRVAAAGEPEPDRPGGVVGPYKLLQQIGEGGMGTVFLAEQTHPVRRQVALKVVKPGMDSRQVVARFGAERQALALMDHPNIARVYDAGTTDSGRPFFVMELVHGVPITQFCDGRKLTPRERLELFVPVCRAVQHAHQKGVIHRDLKPSNVLVALYDDRAVPKVIDFGVAKALGPKLTEDTLFTECGQTVGTLEYMSPEQAELNQLDVDTRSDVYSLGVLLYELLTGTTPLGRKRLREAALVEVLRIIREEEPPRPSARLSTTAELPLIAASRGVDPRRLRGLVRGELDWIVMRCLEKDRDRRYETANGLARDVERYLNDEPVQACAPSAGYRLRKFVRRHRGPVLAAALVLLALVGGVVGTTWEMIRATDAEASTVAESREKDLALQDKDRALQDKDRALQDKVAALDAARTSEGNAQNQLFHALLHQAHGLRLSGQVGQRFDSLKALAEAARMARARGYGGEEFLKLRSEAVACLALPDLRFERTLLENAPNTYWVAFDPEFRYVVWSDLDGNLGIRRVADGADTARLPGPGARPGWVVLKFSSDGRWLLVEHDVPGRRPRVALWEFRDGNPVRTVRLEHPCDFSPDGRFLAGARPDGSIAVYETASGREVKRIAEGMGAAGVEFHPDGRQLAVWLKSVQGVIVVLDLETGEEVHRYKFPKVGMTDHPAWSGDGRLLAVPCDDQRVYVWDHDERRLQSVLEGHTSRGIVIRFSHAGDFLMSASWDGTTRLWDPVTGRELVRVPGASHAMHVRRDDRRVSLARDYLLEVWEVAAGSACHTLHHGRVGNRTDRPADWGPRQMDFSPDGRLLVSCSFDGARLWDLATFTEVGHLPAGPTADVRFHPDGNSLFTYGVRGLHRWPIRREREPTPDHPGGIEVLRIGPRQVLDVPGNWTHAYLEQDRRGRWLAAVDYPRGRAVVLDPTDPSHRLVLEHPGVSGCWLSPDGRWAVTNGVVDGKDIRKVWDTSDGTPVWWEPPAGETIAFFTADGRWLVTSPPGDAPLRLWQVGTWQPGPTLPKHGRRYYGAMPSPEGTLLFWPGGGGEPPRLVHAGTGEEMATLEAREFGSASPARFSPDGTRVAVGTGNHTIHVWDLRSLRRGLADLDLDWDLPPYPPAGPGDARPVRVDVTAGRSAP
jgi:serine/threonine protein kinase/WD40 repeat protein